MPAPPDFGSDFLIEKLNFQLNNLPVFSALEIEIPIGTYAKTLLSSAR